MNYNSLKTFLLNVSFIQFFQVIQFFIHFILTIVFVNYTDQADYGFYLLIIASFNIFQIISFNGFISSGINDVKLNKLQTFLDISWLRLKYQLILLPIISIYFHFIGIEHLINMIFTIIFLINNFFIYFLSYFVGRENFLLDSLVRATSKILSSLICIFTIFITDEIEFIVIAFLVPESFVLILSSIFVIFKIKSQKNTSNFDDFLLSKNFGVKLTFISLIGVVLSALDRILIGNFASLELLASFTIIITLPDLSKIIFKNISHVLFPKLINDKYNTLIVFKFVFFKFLLSLFGVLLYNLLADVLFSFFFPNYTNLSNISKIYSFTIIAFSTEIIPRYLEAKKMTSGLFYINTIPTIIQIFLFTIGLLLYGFYGVLIAKIIGRVFVSIIRLSILYKYHKDVIL